MYRIVTDGVVADQVAGLPGAALAGYAQTLAVLELVPWNGDPINADNSEGNVRQERHERPWERFTGRLKSGRSAVRLRPGHLF